MDSEPPHPPDPNSEPTGKGPSDGNPDGAIVKPWLGRRKRIVAREVVREVESEMLSAADGSLKPADVIDIPSLPSPGHPPEAIIDPTLFMERHRRPEQHRAYRLTQLMIAITLLTASAAILGTLMEHRLRALVIAGISCVAAAISVKLVRSSRLAHRLRGYVVVSCIFSLLAVAACFL
jgi:hypothetical protein